jgi:hypothetical protein
MSKEKSGFNYLVERYDSVTEGELHDPFPFEEFAVLVGIFQMLATAKETVAADHLGPENAAAGGAATATAGAGAAAAGGGAGGAAGAEFGGD